MKKRIIWAAFAAIALTACQRELDVQEQTVGVFTATTESTTTKTELSPDGSVFNVVWQSGDQIAIEDAAANAGVYSTTSTGTHASFTFASGKEAATAPFKAWYPAGIYNEGKPELPATQAYVAGNITGAPMYAESETPDLVFKNLGGIVRLNVSTSQEGKKVRKIVLSADKGLSGPFTITEDAAAVSGTAGITLDCGETGVAIGAESLPFHIAVPAGTYNPLKITVITTDGEVQVKTSTSGISIARSKITPITLGFGDLNATGGSAAILDGTTQPWVRLWDGGPRWAKFNVGSTIDSWAGVTEYTNPDVVGGYYSIRGRYDSVPDSYKTDDTAGFVWGSNWATPDRDQFQALLDNCDWTFCDGETVQFEAGCTLKGWKVCGKESGFTDNAIFLPLCGQRDQNWSARAQMGTRGLYWTNGTGTRYFLELFAGAKNLPYHDPDHGCSVRAICVGDDVIVPGQFELYQNNVNTVPDQFNAYSGLNPKLIVQEDISQKITITRAEGEIDLNGHSVTGFYLQNTDPEKTVTIKNGTVTFGIDGKDGQSDYFGGKVLLENVNVGDGTHSAGDCVWTDGHDLTINGGTVIRIEHKKSASTPGKLTIQDGCFGEVYRYVDKYGGEDNSTIILYGGKYKIRPATGWCADGYKVAANTGSDKEDYPYVVVEGDPSDDWFIGPATDLSVEATANTYIVSEPGTYKFKATVKGNGGLDPVTGTTATPIAAADITGATVLWELSAAGRAVKYEDELYQIGYKDGYVLFNTPDTFVPGDAYVAVFKDGEGGKDGQYDKDVDEILWSWLIWATEKPSETLKDGLLIMDRNLGAVGTGNVYCRGMMYEWGRKDPFPSPNNGSYTPNTFYPDRMTAFSISDFDAEGMTVAYSVAHPTTYLKGFSSKRYWQTESEFTLNMWWSGEKTIYDPCPAGWKVPSKEEMQTVINSGVNLPGNGFIGNVSTDFGYGNPGSQYYWTSTGYDRNYAWGYHGGFTNNHVDDATRSGWSIRPVKEKPAVDLSAEETANCYLVSQQGKYKFKATLKGNGAADHSGISKNTDPATIAKAELIWATFNTTTAPTEGELIKDISYADGYVTFSTGNPYKEGNALVAIKDAEGTILWSWHLWFESDDMLAKSQIYPVTHYAFMDRNLGALTNCYAADNALDFGFTYQRGRKDPFMTSATRTTYTALGVLGTYTSYTGGSNVANSIKNPTVVFGYDSWGGGAEQWSGTNKTIFDPCPPGWRIPGKDAWTQFNAVSFKVYKDDWNTYHGRMYNNVAWYPATGDRWGSDHNNTGARLDQWGDRELYADASGMDTNCGSNPGHGYSVRCVRDMEPVQDIPGAANTYLITQAGSYSFDATVKGNGGLDPATGKQATRIDKASIAGVKVLWEIGEQGRAIKHDGTSYAISYSDGTVTFSTPDTFVSGAASVAIYNASDEILWSWLIWTTEQPSTVEHNGKVFMDRNLGAVSPGNNLRGFLYQWGRKDPFSAATGSYNSFTFVPALTTAFGTINGIQTIAYTIAHPTMHINNGDANSWMSQEEYETRPWRDDIKTIYDPSPEGWRVPTADEQDGFSGLPGTGFSNALNEFGNPNDGYYRSTTISAYPRAYAFRGSGQKNNWGTNPAMAIRCVKE
ncbi:MAG: hypothetical protein II421_02290 [Bacteroidales bacterium]|nr:hypothetical protein [Bacteroidales bacterium]